MPLDSPFRAERTLLVMVASVLAVLVGVLTAPAAAAQTPPPAEDVVSWQIQPSSKTGPTTRPYFVYDLAPGATMTDYVGITNLGPTPLTVNLYPSDGYNAADGTFDVHPAADKPVDLGSWVAVAQRSVTVAPRTRSDVPFTLTVPANATPGDHAGGIVASVTSTTTDATGSTVNVDRRVGTRMYLQVNGPMKPALTVDGVYGDFGAAGNPLSKGTTTVRYRVSNTGNVRLAAHQRVVISGPFGLLEKSVALADLPELLPGASIERSVEVPFVAAVHLTATVQLEPLRTLDPTLQPEVTSRLGLWALAWWHAMVLALLLALLVWAARRPAARAVSRRLWSWLRRQPWFTRRGRTADVAPSPPPVP